MRILFFVLLIAAPVFSKDSTGQTVKKITDHPAVSANIRLLETWIENQISYGKFPGVAVGIVYNGETIYQKGFGYADKENKIPSTPETTYRIASLSKVFTAIGIMILRDESKLSLDDPIEKHLPWFKIKPLKNSDPSITIRQVLSHSSGLSTNFSNYNVDFIYPSKEELQRLASVKIKTVYSPNTIWKYGNEAYSLLGQIIEVVSGMTFEQFIKDRILDPLQMTSTTASQNKSFQPHLATGYGRKMPDGSQQIFPFIDTKAGAPMGGMSSNVIDLCKFMEWQMRLMSNDKEEVLNPNTLREMQRVQFVDEDWQWGYGFGVFHDNGKVFIGHNGGFMGYLTHTSINAKEKTGITVCVNSLDGEPFPGSFWSITDRIREWICPAILDIASTSILNSTQYDYAEYEGIYSNLWAEKMVIYLDGKLQVVNPNSPNPKKGAWVLEQIEKDLFVIQSTPRYDPVGEKFVFKRNEKGQVYRYEYGEGGTSLDKNK